jgi:hypothetical protein
MTDPRHGLGGYINDANHGGFQLDRAIRLAKDPTVRLDWVAILIAEARSDQRPEVLANRNIVDTWKARLNPLGVSVGVEVVHSTDPVADAAHYQQWKHTDFFMCNAEDVYVMGPSGPGRSKTFLDAVGETPPLILSTNGNPAQRPMDMRRWEQRGALFATQAYWQFEVVKYLTPKVAHQFAYLPTQVNVGPSDTSWWYRIWLKGKGPPKWAQTIGTASGDTLLRLKRSPKVYNVQIKRGPDGGLYVTSRTLREEGTGRKVGTFVGLFPDKRITPHISNELGEHGRPSPADITAKISACPTRKVSVGVFTLDNAADVELRAVRAGMSA